MVVWAAATLLMVLKYGTGMEKEYYRLMVFVTHIKVYTSTAGLSNLSTAAFVNRFFNISGTAHRAPYFSVFLGVWSLLLTAYTGWLTRGRFHGVTKLFLLQFSIVFAYLFAVYPFVHEHHYVLLYLLIISSWASVCRAPAAKYALLFVVSYVLLGLKYSLVRFPLFSKGILSVASCGKLLGVLILFYLASCLIKEERAQEASC